MHILKRGLVRISVSYIQPISRLWQVVIPEFKRPSQSEETSQSEPRGWLAACSLVGLSWECPDLRKTSTIRILLTKPIPLGNFL